MLQYKRLEKTDGNDLGLLHNMYATLLLSLPGLSPREQ